MRRPWLCVLFAVTAVGAVPAGAEPVSLAAFERRCVLIEAFYSHDELTMNVCSSEGANLVTEPDADPAPGSNPGLQQPPAGVCVDFRRDGSTIFHRCDYLPPSAVRFSQDMYQVWVAFSFPEYAVALHAVAAGNSVAQFAWNPVLQPEGRVVEAAASYERRAYIQPGSVVRVPPSGFPDSLDGFSVWFSRALVIRADVAEQKP